MLRLRNLPSAYENHVCPQQNAMTSTRSCMKMTSRRGSRMISKAERRLEASSGLYGARPRTHSSKRTPQEYFHLFLSPPIFTCVHPRPRPSAISFSSPPHRMTSPSRAVYIHTSTDYLLLPFRRTIFNRRHISYVAFKSVLR